MSICKEGEHRFYYWRNSNPKYQWYIIIAIYLKDANAVTAEYYIFSSDKDIALINSVINANESELVVAGIDLFDIAIEQCKYKIESAMISLRAGETKWLSNKESSLKPIVYDKEDAFQQILQWRNIPHIKNMLELIEGKTACISLRDYLNVARSIKP